jgi:excisionase family DNA binding protein
MHQQSARRAPSSATTPHLRPAEVAELLGVSPKTVTRWAREGKLPCLRTLGGHRRYPEHEIRELAAGLHREVAS